MKTTTYPIPLSATTRHALLLQVAPAMAIGIVSAVLVYRIAGGGLFGMTGERLPLAVLGTSAWLYAGLAMGARHPLRILAHIGFGIALFAAAVTAMAGPVASLAPWFLAQAVWVLMHRRDITHPGFVPGWVAFTAALAAALVL